MKSVDLRLASSDADIAACFERSQGYGDILMRWLVQHAVARGCDELHLDSGVQRFDAHRFYMARRMKISSHHFVIDLRLTKQSST